MLPEIEASYLWSILLETLNLEVIQFYLLVDNVIWWTDFRVSQSAEFLDVNAKVGCKIMEGMKMLEGREFLLSVGQEFVLQVSKSRNVIIWEEGVLYWNIADHESYYCCLLRNA